MTKYDKLKEKYNHLIKQSLENNKKILIESFVEYYGDEFRYIIEKRYNEITFIYYIDWSTIDFVINEYLPKIDNLDKYTDFINFSNSRRKHPLEKILKKIKYSIKLPDNLIGMTNDSIVNNNSIINWLFRSLSESAPRSYNYGNINNMNRLISFQILALNERAIIHEINHAITRDALAFITEDNNHIGVVQKTGLSVDVFHKNSGERNVEELLNEKASEEIEKIFKSKGGDFSSFCLNIPFLYPYKYNFYLIDEFYAQFKKYIKISRISDNKNELVSRVGKDEYEELVKLVDMCYTEDILQIESIKEKTLPKIRKIIDKMNENARSSHTTSKEEINTYIEQLQKAGYNLKMINNLYDESDNPIHDTNKGVHKK